VETLDLVRTQEPPPPSRLQPSVPLDLETICLKCLRKEPEKRYASAAELADDLVRYQRGEPIQARPVGRLERAVKWVKRNPVVTGAAAAVVLALAVGATYSYLKYRETEAALARESERVTERDDALGKADEAIKKRDKANDELTHRLGVSAMVLANAAYDNRDVKLAAERLDKVPVEQRGWEWHYLKRQLNGGIFTLYGHKRPVTSVAFSPDGTRIVTGAGDQTKPFEAKVWDARTGMLLFELKGLTQSLQGFNLPVVFVAFSADSKRIVTAGGDNTARVWDATTGALQLELKAHEGDVMGAAFSPDGTRIVTGSEGNKATVWDASTGKALGELKGHRDAVTKVSYSADGTRILTGCRDQAVRVWDAKTGKVLLEAKGMMSDDSKVAVAFSPDGQRIVAGRRDGTARVIDARTGAVLLELKGRPLVANTFQIITGVLCVAFSPDGTRIVTGGTTDSGSGEASVWDARTGAELLQLKGHTGLVTSASFSPDGERIITGSTDGTAKVWDARTGTPRLELEGIKRSPCAALSPDGTRIVTGRGQVPGEAMVWDARTGMPQLALKGLKSRVTSVAFSKDGTRIATGGFGSLPGALGGKMLGEATVWDARTGAPLVELQGLKEPVNSVAFSPDGTRILTAVAHVNRGRGGAELKVWDAKTGTVLLDLTQKGFFFEGERGVSVAFSPDGRRFVTGGMRNGNSFDTDVKVWDAGTGTVLLEMKEKSPVLSVAFSKDGTRIVSGNRGKTATVWNAETGTALVELKGHTGNVFSVAFSPDGKRVVTSSGDRTVRVWDARTGTTLAELKGHTGAVTSVSFSADGTRILTASGLLSDKSGEVFVWDARTSKEPPDEEEIAYRRLHMQPNPRRYRAGYLAARAAKDDFAAAFYLNLIPPDERKRVLEQAEADALAALSQLAAEHNSAGKLEEAVPLFIEVLNFNKAKLGPDDPATIQTAETLGRIYNQTGQFEKAIPLYEDVLKHRKAKFGREHQQTLSAMLTLGWAYRDAGRLKEAIAVLEEEGTKNAWLMPHLLEVYALAGEHAKIIDLSLKQLAEVRKSRPNDSNQLVILHTHIGRAYLGQKKWSEAEPHLREYLTLREKENWPDHWTMFDAQSLLGGSLLGQKKYADAEPLLLKGYEGMKQREKAIPKEGETRIPEALDRLIELYTATNKPDEAKKWRAERAKYPPRKGW